MSFGSPLALLALLAIPAALGLADLAARRSRASHLVFTNLSVLEAIVPARASRRHYIPFGLLLLALATAAAATAHPRARVPVRVNNATIVLLVDVSGSMSARDVEPTRLDAAVAAMRAFVQRLPKGFKVGLVDFSNFPVVLTEPTADHQQVTQALGVLTPSAGTAIGDGIASAVKLVKTSLATDHVTRRPHGKLPAAIVLLSDGKQTQGLLEPLDAADEARAAGIPVDTVALGTPGGTLGYGFGALAVAPDPGLMRAIARQTGGKTATARNAGELSGFYRTVRSSFGSATQTRDIASWFAAAAALLLLAAVGLGRAWAPALS